MSHTEKKNTKRVALCLGIGLLSVGVAGVGAVTTYQTVISGNTFTASIPEETVEPTEALLTISGNPIVYKFDTTKNNDYVEAAWTLSNTGTVPATFDGQLQLLKNADPELSKALTLEYADDDGNWYQAGTLADQTSFVEALGISNTIANGKTLKIPVRVILTDPTELKGTSGTLLTVNANFVVSYLDTSAPSEPSAESK